MQIKEAVELELSRGEFLSSKIVSERVGCSRYRVEQVLSILRQRGVEFDVQLASNPGGGPRTTLYRVARPAPVAGCAVASFCDAEILHTERGFSCVQRCETSGVMRQLRT